MTNTKTGNGSRLKLAKAAGVLFLVVLANLHLEAQSRPAELRFHLGRAAFPKASEHLSAGASYRHYFGKRGWALEPEYSFMTVMSERYHRDDMLILNVVKDLTRPSRRWSLDMIMGGGIYFHRTKRRFWKGPGGLGWGMGLKIWGNDRFYISPQFRIGHSPSFRFSVNLGFAPRR
ncbi:MAG: hypothetical protein OXI69_17175 [Acidobacteriota bacterium]|nr:hypothetical protein [Acidobacteriota bacterium]